jgi:hypothetical protein
MGHFFTARTVKSSMFRFLSFIIKRDNILIIEKTSHVALTYDTLTVPDNPSGTLGTVHRAFENEELHAKNCVFFLNLSWLVFSMIRMLSRLMINDKNLNIEDLTCI